MIVIRKICKFIKNFIRKSEGRLRPWICFVVFEKIFFPIFSNISIHTLVWVISLKSIRTDEKRVYLSHVQSSKMTWRKLFISKIVGNDTHWKHHDTGRLFFYIYVHDCETYRNCSFPLFSYAHVYTPLYLSRTKRIRNESATRVT